MITMGMVLFSFFFFFSSLTFGCIVVLLIVSAMILGSTHPLTYTSRDDKLENEYKNTY